ncbi:fructokinase [Herbihabitans rhizosphaerae]|uniref:Fructokinase n=1 Tax=Herbihabitans rhizosphaerae TaxID=1872711 RepID=A0A4Q7KMD8_9PSEU|nr:carbohydrate kinase [Herbihabitans rhizosphaerae]RZS37070.1 fructokinase [Herbihabitans rhizosphaerae]
MTSVAVLGEAIVDLVPAPDGSTFTAVPGGSPYNVAIGLGRLDRRPLLLARLSGDGFGAMLRRHAAASGVDLSSAAASDAPSALAVASLDGHGQASYEFYGDLSADWVAPRKPLRLLHFGSIASWHGDRVREFVDSVRAAGTLIAYDPNVRPGLLGDPAGAVAVIQERIHLAHVVKASEEDVRWLYPHVDPVTAVRGWLALGPSLVILTRGSAGTVSFTSQGVHASRAARQVPVVDTVGAGDAFTAGLIDGLLARDLTDPQALGALEALALVDLLERAGTLAELTCARRGADPPTRAELDAHYAGWLQRSAAGA